MIRLQIVIALTLGLVLAAGCGGDKKAQFARDKGEEIKLSVTPGSPDDKPVAKVGDYTIYISDFESRLAQLSPYKKAQIKTLDDRKAIVEDMIKFELMAMEAKAKGYASHPDVIRMAKQVMIQKLIKDEFDTKIEKEEVPDAVLQEEYDKNLAEYVQPEKRRVSIILLPAGKGSDTAQAAHKEALAAKDDPKVFRDLATKYSSDEESKKRGGDLGYVKSTEDGGELPAEVSAALFGLKEINEIAPPVSTDKGIYIVKLTGKRPRIERTFDQVKSSLKHKVWRDRRTKAFDQFVDDIRKKSPPQIFDQTLESVTIDTGDQAAGMPPMPPSPAAPAAQPGAPAPAPAN